MVNSSFNTHAPLLSSRPYTLHALLPVRYTATKTYNTNVMNTKQHGGGTHASLLVPMQMVDLEPDVVQVQMGNLTSINT